MPTLRRLTALLSGLLLLQLTLLGADWSCGSHERPAERARAAMSGEHESHDASRSQAPGGGCDAARAPGDCATRPSCAAMPTIPASVATTVAVATGSDAVYESVSIASQSAAGPDVPPPRG